MKTTDSGNIKILLERVSNNDQKAFGILFQMFYKRLLNFAYQYVRTKEIAEEIVSDVFIKLWNKRAEITKVEKPEAYLFISVKNGSLNYLEKFSLLQVCQIPESSRSELVNTNNPQKELEWKELLFKMDEAISTLPAECQRIFRLSKEEGFKAKEVAEILNISPRTVETQLYRAVRKIDDILSSYLQRSFKKKEVK
ncbi:MAG TPA: RNA polymerase sigma-70 factor [Cytophagales bacterium]|nr:RNA polymerase sigma-70 factor [Cytophagales bacterium]